MALVVVGLGGIRFRGSKIGGHTVPEGVGLRGKGTQMGGCQRSDIGGGGGACGGAVWACRPVDTCSWFCFLSFYVLLLHGSGISASVYVTSLYIDAAL